MCHKKKQGGYYDTRCYEKLQHDEEFGSHGFGSVVTKSHCARYGVAEVKWINPGCKFEVFRVDQIQTGINDTKQIGYENQNQAIVYPDRI